MPERPETAVSRQLQRPAAYTHFISFRHESETLLTGHRIYRATAKHKHSTVAGAANISANNLMRYLAAEIQKGSCKLPFCKL